jgi:hypothetical protein
VKCARAVCQEEGLYLHVDLPGKYCEVCADRINQANSDHPHRLVMTRVHHVIEVLRHKLSEPLHIGHWDGPLAVKGQQYERRRRAIDLATRLLEGLPLESVATVLVMYVEDEL